MLVFASFFVHGFGCFCGISSIFMCGFRWVPLLPASGLLGGYWVALFLTGIVCIIVCILGFLV